MTQTTQSQECPGKGCPACAQGREGLDRFLEGVNERYRRYREPTLYPFSAGKHTLHRTRCSTTDFEMWGGGLSEPLEGSTYDAVLMNYSHLPEQNRDGRFESRYPYPAFLAMTEQEALEWVKERIGPKGGKKYKLCRICAPDL